MAFYLSKRNRALLTKLLDRLKNSSSDVEFVTPYPSRLAELLRNTSADPDLKWVKEKYIIKELSDRVYCVLKDIPILETDNSDAILIDNKVTLIDIMNQIINNTPERIIFSNQNLTDDEIERLETFLTIKEYSLTINDGTLTIKKQ